MTITINLKTVSTAIGVFVSMGIAGNFWVDYRINKAIEETIQPRVDTAIAHAHTENKGSLSYDISNDVGIERNNVHSILSDMVKEHMTVIDVGIKAQGKHIDYLHIDGFKYTPVWWADKRDYHFKKPSGEWEMCH